MGPVERMVRRRMNRPLRTRTVGGVGGRELETPGYPMMRDVIPFKASIGMD